MAQFTVAHLDEIEEVSDSRSAFRPIRQHFGIMSFGITASTAHADGELLINEHDESPEEPESGDELYVVISGHARFEIDGETEEAPAGTFVHVPIGVKRTAIARDAGTTVLAIGAGRAGEAYQPSGWELFAPLWPLFESGEFEQVADRAQKLLVDDPPYAALYYNLACAESRAGRIDDALTHLRRAVELSAALGPMARDDEDFTVLRDRPEFADIVG